MRAPRTSVNSSNATTSTWPWRTSPRSIRVTRSAPTLIPTMFTTPRALGTCSASSTRTTSSGTVGTPTTSRLRTTFRGPASPIRKITIEDVKYVLSSHYQGTPQSIPYGKLGDQRTRHMFRPIGINRQSQLSVMHGPPVPPAGEPCRAVDCLRFQPVQHAGAVLPERRLHAEVPRRHHHARHLRRTSTGETASSRPCATPASPTPPMPSNATRRRPAAWATAW